MQTSSNNIQYEPCGFLSPILLFFASALFVPITWSQQFNPEGLTLTLELEKSVYLVDEPIFVEAVEKNISEGSIITSWMSLSVPQYFKIIVVNSADGDTFKFKGGRDFLVRPYPKVLQPGDKLYLVENLLVFFGQRTEKHTLNNYLPPGQYAVQALHFTNYRWQLDQHELAKEHGGDVLLASQLVDKGLKKSNIVQFTVEEPEGEEKIVHQKLLEAYGVARSIVGRPPIEATVLYRAITKEHPNSVYTMNCNNRLIIHSYNVKSYQVNYDGLFERYKDRFFAYKILQRPTVSKNLKALENHATQYPNTKLAEYTEQYRKALLKKHEE